MSSKQFLNYSFRIIVCCSLFFISLVAFGQAETSDNSSVNSSDNNNSSENNNSSDQNVVTVSTEAFSTLVFYPERSAPASVVSLNNSQIPAEISAVITAIPVRVGEQVAQGDLLAELDCRQSQLNYKIEAAKKAQLESRLALDKRELARLKTLMAGGNIGESLFDQSQTEVINNENQLLAQQALLELASINVQRCTVTAPYDGVVTARLASVGENLQFGTPVIQLVQLDNLEVIASIALGDVDAFTSANAYLFKENGNSYQLKLLSLLPLVEANARVRQARFIFSDLQAISGSSGRLVWESPDSHAPARFLQLRNGILGIFIAENNRAKFIPLEHAEEGRPVRIELSDESLIITDGRFGLVDGQPINIR